MYYEFSMYNVERKGTDLEFTWENALAPGIVLCKYKSPIEVKKQESKKETKSNLRDNNVAGG